MRKQVKRGLSFILSLAMVVTLVPGNIVSAKSAKQDETEAKLREYLRTAVSDAEYPNGAFGIGDTQLTVKEGKKKTITIVRQGNTDKEQKVRFKAVDVSAVYGQDYLLTVRHSVFKTEQLEKPEGSETLLEQSGELGEEAAATESAITAEESEQEEVATGAAATAETSEQDKEKDTETKKNEETFPAAEVSSLQTAYSLQNGGEQAVQSDWKEVNPKDVSDTDKKDFEKGDAKVRKAIEKLDGAETVLTFGPGEYKKEIVLTAIDDEKSESDEQIAVFLSSEDGSKVGEFNSGYVNIKDNDAAEKVTFQIKEPSVDVTVDENRAKVTIVRKTGIDQIAIVKAGTKELTAEAGKDYEVTTEDVFFAPGVKEKDFYVPITGERDDIKTFYVGIMQDGEVAETDGQAALVTICKRDPDSKDGDVSLSAQSSTVSMNCGYGWYSGTEYSYRAYKGIDTRLATKITVTYDIEGEYSQYDKGQCKDVTKYDKMAYIALAGWSDNVVEEKSKFFNGKKTYTGQTVEFTRELSEVEQWSALGSTGSEIMAKVSGTNAKINITKVEIKFDDYKLNINNDSGSGHYKEQQVSGFINGAVVKKPVNNDSDDDDYGIRLGTVYFGTNKSNYSKSLASGENTDLHYAFSGKRNSQKVVADSDSVEFKGYYLAKPNSTNGQHSELIKASDMPGTLTYDFVSKYKNYLFSGATFQLYPVFAPKDVTITLANTDANKGSFLNFTNQKQSFVMTRMDSLKVDAAASPGNGVSEIQLTSNSGLAATNKDSNQKSRLETGLGNTNDNKMVLGNGEYSLKIYYEQAKIKVMYDPAYANDGDLKEKGKVYYMEKDSDGDVSIVAQADESNNYQFELNNISIDKTYNIIGDTGITAEEKDVKETTQLYTTYWRDGNTDEDEDGVFKSQVGNYTVFTPVLGSVMPLVARTAFSRLYFSYKLREQATTPQDVIGHLRIGDEMILTGKKVERGVNGATVTCEGVQTITEPGGIDPKESEDEKQGFFRIKSKYFAANDYRLVNAQCDFGEDGKFNTSFVVNPAIEKDCVINTAENVVVDDAHIYKKSGNNWNELSVVPDSEGYYSSLTNGNKDYKITLHAAREGAIITGAKMKFYDLDGKEVENAVVEGKEVNAGANNGIFYFEINPSSDAANGLNLPAGATARVNFTDSNGNISLQREVGLMFTQSLGPIEFLNSFDFGGADKAIKLIGNIDGAFNLGWSGKFDDKAEDVTDENGKATGEKRISVGYSKEVINKSSGGKNPILDAAESLGKADQDLVDKQRALNKTMNKIADGKWDKDKDGDPDKKMEDDIKAVEEATKTRDTKKTEYEKTADTEKTKEKSNTKVTTNVKLELGVSLALTFGCKNAKYYFENMTVTATVKGEFSVNVEYATPIGVTIYMKLTAGGTGSASFIIKERSDTLTKYYIADLVNEDSNSQLDIFDCNPNNAERKFDAYGEFTLAPFIGIEVGAGALGCKVTLDGRATFNMKFYTSTTENTGSVNLNATLTVKVLCFTHDWEFVSKDYQLFGSSASALDELENKNYLYQSTDILEPEEAGYMKGGTNWKDAGISAQSLDEDEKAFAEKALGDKILENPSFKMITLDDTKGSEKYLAVFLNTGDPDQDEGRNKYNNQAAYYVYYENGEWGTPVMIEDDGTFDQDVDVFPLGSRGAVVTWSTSPKAYTSKMDKTEQQNNLDLHAAFVGMDGKLSGDIQKVTYETSNENINDYDDFAADVEANVSYDETSKRMVIYYQKKEYTYDGEELLGDVIYPQFTLMSARYYDFAGADGFDGNWVEEYPESLASDIKEDIKKEIAKEINKGETTAGTDRADVDKRYQAYVAGFYGQEFFEYLPAIDVNETLNETGYWAEKPTVANLNNTKAVIVDSDARNIAGKGLFAYTVDKDGDHKTLGDRDVVMQVYDFEKQVFQHPIVMTADNVEDSNVRFVQLNEEVGGSKPVYLTWLNNGNIVGMNVSRIIANKGTILESYDRDENGKADVYYLNKTAPASADDLSTAYIPPEIYVKGEVAEVDSAKSAITGFDVHASDDYVYFVWTQSDASLQDGVEEGSAEAADPTNTRSEEQIYTARYDINKTEMTQPVQVTSKFGTYYRDVAFAVEGEDLVGLVYKAGSRLVDWEEFNESVEENNELAEKQEKENTAGIVENNEKVENVTEDSFAPYYVADIENAKPVTFRLNPVGNVKIKNAEYVDIIAADSGNSNKEKASEEDEDTEDTGRSLRSVRAGSTATVTFDVLNDGVGTASDLTVTVKDEDGNSVFTEEVSKMLGGFSESKTCYVDIPEDALSSAVTIEIKDKDGSIVAEQTVEKQLEESLSIDNLSIEPTANRNEYIVSGDVENIGTAKAKAGTFEIGARKAVDGSAAVNDSEENDGTDASEKEYTYDKYTEVSHPELLPGEKTSFAETIIVDPAKDFVTETDKDSGHVTESGEIYVKAGDTIGTDVITREISGEAAKWVKAIQKLGVTGAVNDTVNVTVGETTVLSPEVVSSLASEKDEITGSEGLQFRFEAADESEDVASISANGAVVGQKTGKTKVKMYAFAKDHEFVTTADVGSQNVEGTDTSSYLTSPEVLVYSKDITVNVSEETKKVTPTPTVTPAPASQTTATALKKGATFTSGNVKYKVTSAKSKTVAVNAGKNKNITKATIPATVKKNGVTYKVTSISAKAFKGYKKLKKVTIGKNVTKIGNGAFRNCKLLKSVIIGKSVTKIGKRAFMNCKKLKTITVKTKKLKSIGLKAFKGIHKKAVFKVRVAKAKRKTVRKKLRKLLKSKTGFKKTMKIK